MPKIENLTRKDHSWKALGLKRNHYYVNRGTGRLYLIVQTRRLGIKIRPVEGGFVLWVLAADFKRLHKEYNP
jgi:hypothetical protein